LVRNAFPEESIYLYNSFDPRLDDAEHQKDSMKQKETKQVFYSRVIDSFMKSQIRHQQSEVFLLYLARIYMKKLENASKALNLVERVKTIAGSSIPMRNSLESFRSGLQETYFKSLHYSAEDLELANYFSYREDFTSLKEAMQKEIKFQLEFWQELSNDTINIKRTVDFSNQIDFIYIGIRNRWRKKAAEFSKVYPSSLLMYGLYLDAIRGLPSESVPMIQSYYNFNKNNNYKGKMGSLNDATALVVASIEKEKLGVVVDASNTVESLFGLPKEKVLGSKINTLMATFIAQRHDWFMQRYLDTTTKNINKKINSYGKTANGELVELDIDLRLYPYLDKGVNMMAHIKQVNVGDRIFIVNPNGSVAESSPKMQRDGEKNGLNFKILNVLEKCSEFSKVNTAFNTIYGGGAVEKELKTKLFEETEMSFVKDRNATEEMLGTKDNQITNNYTQLDTHADQFLKTKPNEDLPLLKSTNENLNVPWSSTLKARTFMNESNMKTLTKAKTLVTDEEAKSICDAFETSGILKFDKLKIGDDDENKHLIMDVRIEPYAVAGNVYKIVRAMDIRVEEIKKIELEVNSPRLMMERISGNDSNPLSPSRTGTVGLSNEVIPEERSDELPRKETSLEQKITFKQKQVAHDDSEHPITSMKKRNDTNDQFNFSRKEAEEQQNVDMRNSITGKGASSTKSYSRMDMKLIKTLNDFFGEQKIRTVTKISIYGVYVIMLAVLALAFINYYFTQNSLNEIDGGVTIVYTASSRLTSALKAWQWSLVIYSRMVGLRPQSALAATIQKNIGNRKCKHARLEQSTQK
jgi:PAS domain S-box-containing protein